MALSDGVRTAAALLARHPKTLAGSILFRPLSPFTTDAFSRRRDRPFLVVDETQDQRRFRGTAEDGQQGSDVPERR